MDGLADGLTDGLAEERAEGWLNLEAIGGRLFRGEIGFFHHDNFLEKIWGIGVNLVVILNNP